MQPWTLGDHRALRRWVPTLLAAGLRVIRMDRRGAGQSGTPPPGYKFTPTNLVEDIVRFLDAVGLERIHYVGQSLGVYWAHTWRLLIRSESPRLPCARPLCTWTAELPSGRRARLTLARSGLRTLWLQALKGGDDLGFALSQLAK
jgi:pimeloyl-ACP methyl ester carboxylesterase